MQTHLSSSRSNGKLGEMLTAKEGWISRGVVKNQNLKLELTFRALLCFLFQYACLCTCFPFNSQSSVFVRNLPKVPIEYILAYVVFLPSHEGKHPNFVATPLITFLKVSWA